MAYLTTTVAMACTPDFDDFDYTSGSGAGMTALMTERAKVALAGHAGETDNEKEYVCLVPDTVDSKYNGLLFTCN